MNTGDQRADGLFGGFLVREPKTKDRMSHLYDRDEHFIVVNEWTMTSGQESYVLEYQNNLPQNPHTIIVNGYGRFPDPKSQMLPPPIFEVEKVRRRRIFFFFFI